MLLPLLSIFIIHSTPFDEIIQESSFSKDAEDFSKFDNKESFRVLRFQFFGNREISNQQLENLLSSYKSFYITKVEIKKIISQIESFYIGRGYSNVKVMNLKKKKPGNIEVFIKEGNKTS